MLADECHGSAIKYFHVTFGGGKLAHGSASASVCQPKPSWACSSDKPAPAELGQHKGLEEHGENKKKPFQGRGRTGGGRAHGRGQDPALFPVPGSPGSPRGSGPLKVVQI